MNLIGEGVGNNDSYLVVYMRGRSILRYVAWGFFLSLLSLLLIVQFRNPKGGITELGTTVIEELRQVASIGRTLTVIPISVAEQNEPPSTTRILINVSGDGGIVAIGRQNISLLGGNPLWGLGAEHAFAVGMNSWGNNGYDFSITTDPEFPITFKVVDQGYAYLCGRGTINIKGGKEYKLGFDVTEKQWIAGLKSEHQIIREGSSEAIARLRITRAIPDVIETLEDTSWEVRRNAAEALGMLGDHASVQHLKKLLQDRNEDVREAAEEAIEMIEGSYPADSPPNRGFINPS